MSRATLTDALILRASRIGEYHKQLLLLCPESGLVRATAFGAYKGKSRLVSTSDPYSYARLHLYRNPVRDQIKVSDIEILTSFEGLRNDLARSYAAALVAEVTIASYAGGGPDYSFPFGLLRRVLSRMDAADPELTERLVFQYLLRYLLHAGFFHIEMECASCAGKAPAFFDRRSSEFLCHDCAPDGSREVSPGLLRYLGSTVEMPLSRALEIGLDRRVRAGLITVLADLLDETMQREVRSFGVYFTLRSA